MRKRFLVPVLAAALLPAAAPAQGSLGLDLEAESPRATASVYALTLVGGDGPTEISIVLSADGSTYVIKANGPVAEVAGCRNKVDDPNELRCPAGQISSFIVRGMGGNDTVTVAKSVRVSTFLYGGEGADSLSGGDGADKLVGNEGADTLAGRAGADFLYGLEGDDELFGGDGNDVVRGGPGKDVVTGGHGSNDDVQE